MKLKQNIAIQNNMITFILGTILGVYLGWKYELAINDFIESIKIHLNIKQYCNFIATHHIPCMVYTTEENNFYSKENSMLNYSDIKAYWSKFYADAFEDVKTFWKDYAKNVEQFYKK